MSGIAFWDDDPESWDLLVIGSQPMPGIWDVEDGSGKRVMDIKKSPGRDGAIIKDRGYENGAVSLVGQLGGLEGGAEDWEKLQQIIDRLRVIARGKQQDPVVINHPKLVYIGITKVYFTEIGVPQINNGIMTVRLRAVEWTPQPKKTGGKKTRQDDILEKELARLKAENTSVLTREWVNHYIDTDNASSTYRASADFQEAQRSGEVPDFRANNPAYSPRP